MELTRQMQFTFAIGEEAISLHQHNLRERKALNVTGRRGSVITRSDAVGLNDRKMQIRGRKTTSWHKT